MFRWSPHRHATPRSKLRRHRAVEFYLSQTRAAVNYRVAGASVRLADAWPLAGALHD
jgi:hypothetical protein